MVQFQLNRVRHTFVARQRSAVLLAFCIVRCSGIGAGAASNFDALCLARSAFCITHPVHGPTDLHPKISNKGARQTAEKTLLLFLIGFTSFFSTLLIVIAHGCFFWIGLFRLLTNLFSGIIFCFSIIKLLIVIPDLIS